MLTSLSTELFSDYGCTAGTLSLVPPLYGTPPRSNDDLFLFIIALFVIGGNYYYCGLTGAYPAAPGMMYGCCISVKSGFKMPFIALDSIGKLSWDFSYTVLLLGYCSQGVASFS